MSNENTRGGGTWVGLEEGDFEGLEQEAELKSMSDGRLCQGT